MQLLVALSGDGGVAAVSRLQHADAVIQGELAHSPARPMLKTQPAAQAWEISEGGFEQAVHQRSQSAGLTLSVEYVKQPI